MPARKERSHAGSAYHAAVQWRLNLLLIPAAHVERIIVEAASLGSQAVASGVQFLCGGRKNIAKARKEVILSAGVSGSPRLHEVSGIGSAELLRSHGIDVTHNNPFVGGGFYHHAGQKPMLISTRRLQDYILCGSSFDVKDNMQPADASQDPAVEETVL